MLSENRKVIVVTTDLMMFEMEAAEWIYAATQTQDNMRRTSITVLKAEPGKGTPHKKIAEFPDIAAVFFDDSVKLVKPDESS